MSLNVSKCKVTHIGHRNPQSVKTLEGATLERTSWLRNRNLGVPITSYLKCSMQCIEAKKAQRMIGYVKRQFGYRSKDIVLMLYNSYCIWSMRFCSGVHHIWRITFDCIECSPGQQSWFLQLDALAMKTVQRDGFFSCRKLKDGMGNSWKCGRYYEDLTASTTPTFSIW